MEEFIKMQTDLWQSNDLATIRPIAESLGFSLDTNQGFHGSSLALYKGSPYRDYFLVLSKLSSGELDMRIVRYDKKIASQPVGSDTDTINRYILFNGVVNSSDEAAIRAILQSTVPRKS